MNKVKSLKFAPNLAPLILSGEKTSTWRLFDDKDLSAGDELEFINSATGESFAKAIISNVKAITFKDLSPNDWQGHGKFNTPEEMYATFSTYYNKPVDENTEVKIIKFGLIK